MVFEEMVFVSEIEQCITRQFRGILASKSIGAIVKDSADLRAVLSLLESFIPQLLRECHTEWEFESLDAVYPETVRKTNEVEVEIIGVCIFTTDQTLMPVHICLQLSKESDEITWLECKLGETGPDGIARIPYQFGRVGKLHVADRLARISHLTPCVLARNLRQSLKNKELLPNHAKMTGEPNG